MNIPYPTPPKFYWRLSLKNRQRYCRYVANPMIATARCINTVLDRDSRFKIAQRMWFRLYCKRGDFCDYLFKRHPDFMANHQKLWSFLLDWPKSITLKLFTP